MGLARGGKVALLDEGDPLTRILAASALQGAMWALMPPVAEWALRSFRCSSR
ncbi:hypothetical protein Aph02nite_30240 [Actinoplanes philippinensis]|uniref:Uncharacterized protein n=1 Tax=Actinoplanes philippinensis TaxID=35752 RepID=A0A1I2EDZ6_9ACTN|nr:hypothetical protein [Actinoplanes philippinensis]GIE77074.1 hypothetical protein Aph02nite_30240 [Actinoplanes philippinensis]SFE90893.1 hypothetical protein SAMN05421541_104381 [Actinoplanes philippinensis]